MTSRAAIYARYSSDRQNALSIDDQVTVCTRRAAERGWDVVATFTDAATSGEAMANRPGLQTALACATAKAFDVLLAEDEDRFARNLEHLAHVFNRLSDLGIGMATLSSERVELMHVAFKGYQAQAWVDIHRSKTRRGMRSNAEKGLATGSRLFGYKSQPGGGLDIVEAEAQVVREIFERYVAGETGRQIADALNRRRIKGPHGGWWNASTILGSPKRGNGVLRTELYAGVKVWNRFDMKKDRATGKRISIAIPKEEWRRTPTPQTRILDQHIWAAAQARLVDRGQGRPEQHRRRPGLFSGLLRCRCGATYTISSREWLTCTAHHERGPTVCDNGRRLRRSALERRVLEGLQEQLLAPEAVEEYVRAFREAEKRHRAEAAYRDVPLRRREAELTRKIERLVDAVADGAGIPDLKVRLKSAQAEREDVRRQLADLDTDVQPIRLHPRTADHYRAKVAGLRAELDVASGSKRELDQSVVEKVRELVDRIEIRPLGPAETDPVDLILFGRLAALIDGEGIVIPQRAEALVAGARFGRIRPLQEQALAIRLRL